MSTTDKIIAPRTRGVVMPAWEVRAFREGRKTQFRRVVRPLPGDPTSRLLVFSDGYRWATEDRYFKCPFGKPGDVLYVRETFYQSGHSYRTYPEDDEWRGWAGSRDVFYAADGIPPNRGPNEWGKETNLENAARLAKFGRNPFFVDKGRNYWRKFPSVHMPAWASRFSFPITEVRLQHVQDITEADAVAEGVAETRVRVGNRFRWRSARGNYARQYDIDHGKGAWARNDWAWAVTVSPAAALVESAGANTGASR